MGARANSLTLVPVILWRRLQRYLVWSLAIRSIAPSTRCSGSAGEAVRWYNRRNGEVATDGRSACPHSGDWHEPDRLQRVEYVSDHETHLAIVGHEHDARHYVNNSDIEHHGSRRLNDIDIGGDSVRLSGRSASDSGGCRRWGYRQRWADDCVYERRPDPLHHEWLSRCCCPRRSGK